MPVLSGLFRARFADESSAQMFADAREALAYWHGRQARLAWHRRAARAEARDHVARWHEHLVRAQLQRVGLEPSHPLAPLVGALALPRREQARRVTAVMLHTRPARLVRRMVVVVTAASIAVVALAVVAIVHLV
jgi:hypothetical protein